MIDNKKLKQILPAVASLSNPIADSNCVEDAQKYVANSLNGGRDYYSKYLLMGGKANKKSYYKALFSFFCYTLDAFIFGDLSRPNAKSYGSRMEALQCFHRWVECENDFSQGDAEKIISSVTGFGDYT